MDDDAKNHKQCLFETAGSSMDGPSNPKLGMLVQTV